MQIFNRLRGGYTTLLKGIAIIMIMISHTSSQFTRAFTPFGGIGVAIFLILSGYGLNESFKRNGIDGFWKKRFSRVWIPYFIAVTLVWLFWEHCTWQEYLLDICCWKTSYWYIGYMVRCYILFWLTARFMPQYKSWALLAIGFSTLFFLDGVQGEQAFSFVTGVLISEKNKKIDEHMCVPLKWVLLLFVVAISLLAFKQTGLYRSIESDIFINLVQTPMKWTFAMGIILGFAFMRFALKSRFLALAGLIGYELYLVHYPFFGVVGRSPIRLALFWLASFIVAYLYYHLNTCISNSIRKL